MEKVGFLEDSPNHKSSGRLFVLILLLTAIIQSSVTLAAGLYNYLASTDGESLALIAAASSGIIVTISGVALTYKSYSKGQETKTP